MLVRDRADGKPSRTWLHRVKLKGGDSFLTVGHFPETSLEKARDEIRKQRELLSKGIHPKTAAPRRRPVRSPQSVSAAAAGDNHSIEFLAHEFLELYVRPARKRPEYVEAILNKDVLPEWKGRDARTIKAREVIELLDKIVARGRRVMANRTAAVLGQMFKFGIHREILDDSPVKLLMRPGGKEKPRQRALSDDELAAYLKDPLACTRQHRLSHVITILLLTAVRRGELAQARWRDLGLDAGTWTLPAANTKTGQPAIVPLTAWAVREFKKLKLAAGRSPWVLPGTDTSEHIDPKLLTRAPAKCAERFKKAGIAPFTLHDLRRTVRTGLGRLKVAQHIAELCLNHAQPGIVGTYGTHAYLDEKRVALEKWAAHLETLRGQ
jgi:integrase